MPKTTPSIWQAVPVMTVRQAEYEAVRRHLQAGNQLPGHLARCLLPDIELRAPHTPIGHVPPRGELRFSK
jgi:hypothetical protein